MGRNRVSRADHIRLMAAYNPWMNGRRYADLLALIPDESGA